jgi:hypothetical protein
MAESAPLSAFAHAPLPDSKTHIRLLEIPQGKYKRPIIFKLTTWRLDVAPPYYAVSYTWGDPTQTIDITVDNQRMEVRQNCEYVLHQAFALRTNELQYYWIDAICIDQDNLQERGHQVSLMGQLYKRASHVLACVGPHSDDSQFLFRMCKKKTTILEEIETSTSRHQDTPDWTSEYWLQDDELLSIRCYSALMPWVRRRLTKAFTAFMQRS